MKTWHFAIMMLILACGICFGAWVYPWISREAGLVIKHQQM